MVKELQQKLEARKVNNKSREAVEVNVDIIQVLEEEIITEVPKKNLLQKLVRQGQLNRFPQ